MFFLFFLPLALVGSLFSACAKKFFKSRISFRFFFFSPFPQLLKRDPPRPPLHLCHAVRKRAPLGGIGQAVGELIRKLTCVEEEKKIKKSENRRALRWREKPAAMGGKWRDKRDEIGVRWESGWGAAVGD